MSLKHPSDTRIRELARASQDTATIQFRSGSKQSPVEASGPAERKVRGFSTHGALMPHGALESHGIPHMTIYASADNFVAPHGSMLVAPQ